MNFVVILILLGVSRYPEMRDRVVAVDGFSKTYCMTGWRLGWAVMPESLAARVHLYLTHAIGCSASCPGPPGRP